MTSYLYHACGLVLKLPIPCGALQAAAAESAVDIDASFGATPKTLDAPHVSERHWEAEPYRFLYRMGRYGRYLVEDGSRITITRHSQTEVADICFHVLYVCLAIALQQRGHLVLHGNTVLINGRGVTFAGHSGAGKSTLLAALVARGYPMLADDITVVENSANGGLQARSGFPHYKLCLDAAERLQTDTAVATPVRWRQKVGIQANSDDFSESPAPLDAIFILEKAVDTALHCQPLQGIDKFLAVQGNIYGPDGIGKLQSQSQVAMQVAGETAVYRLVRPEHEWTLDRVIALVMAQLQVADV